MTEQDIREIRKIVRQEISDALNAYHLQKDLLNSIDKFQDNMNSAFDKLEDTIDKRQKRMNEALDRYENT